MPKKVNKPNKKPRYTKDQIAEALTKNYGLRTYAAKALGCCITTVSDYIKKYPELEDVADQAKEVRIEKSEHRLYDLIDQDKNLKVAATATFFHLKTQAKHKGYIEKQEIDHGEITVVVKQYGKKKDRGSGGV